MLRAKDLKSSKTPTVFVSGKEVAEKSLALSHHRLPKFLTRLRSLELMADEVRLRSN